MKKRYIQMKHNEKTEEAELQLEYDERRCSAMIRIGFNERKYIQKDENYFNALQRLRLDLEKDDIQILCNGAARNVYPSPMMLNMGEGQYAYKLKMGFPATLSDVVNIFDYDNGLEHCSVFEQKNFYNEWLSSLGVK